MSSGVESAPCPFPTTTLIIQTFSCVDGKVMWLKSLSTFLFLERTDQVIQAALLKTTVRAG